jgi:hypothetical protein
LAPKILIYDTRHHSSDAFPDDEDPWINSYVPPFGCNFGAGSKRALCRLCLGVMSEVQILSRLLFLFKTLRSSSLAIALFP